jgi:glycine/D-amino acid oxidase-like deaminating enzyme/nitrite reductase/ring-hydroxylating ferredoxin subunit
MNTTSYWSDSSIVPRFKKLDQDLTVDVIVIGAGITGITTAYLLNRAGCDVALLERYRCGGFDTANTTAHLTCMTDTPLSKLVKHFGKDAAKATWDAGLATIDQITATIRQENIDCDFDWTSGFYHQPIGDHKSDERFFKREAELARSLGFQTAFMEQVPVIHRPGLQLFHQAKFHPLKYLSGLLRVLKKHGCHVFENSTVDEIKVKPFSVTCRKHQIHCKYLVIATHTPLMGKSKLASATLFQTKLYLYTSYAIQAKIPLIDHRACFWDTSTPYNYLRLDHHNDGDYAILGGEDHKTGQEKDTEKFYRNLETRLKKIFPKAQLTHRWSGQVIETPDGLPYIGENAANQFIATGFSGNGMTFGTLAAMMARDAVLKNKNPWSTLFEPHRKPFHGGTFKYLKENKDYPYYLLRDRAAAGKTGSLKKLRRNEGKILRFKGKKVAAFRDPQGKLTLCSPVCTHLQCIVHWNSLEKTWDCPCHGSRFSPAGEVLSGPAEEALEKIDPE